MLIGFVALIITVLHGAHGEDTSSLHGTNGPTFLRIGMTGPTPYFFVKDDRIMGSDMQMVQLLSEKMGFSYNLTVVRTMEKLVRMVRWRMDDLLRNKIT